MSATFDLNDSDVVVIVGSGAGGGTLANELAQKGVNKIVILEAGRHNTLNDVENDEWKMFSKLSWLDKRQTAGAWNPAKTSPNLPAWICKTVGGSTVHWAGVSLRFQPHEFKALSTYGKVADANLLDWPLSYEDMVPFYERAEKKMGVSGSAASGMPELPKSNNTMVAEAGARKIGYKDIASHGDQLASL